MGTDSRFLFVAKWAKMLLENDSVDENIYNSTNDEESGTRIKKLLEAYPSLRDNEDNSPQSKIIDEIAALKESGVTPTSPCTLAEAFIWKQRDWFKYKNFLKDFQGRTSDLAGLKSAINNAEETRIVHYAFANHLDKDLPIFDQHTSRSYLLLTNLEELKSEDLKYLELEMVESAYQYQKVRKKIYLAYANWFMAKFTEDIHERMDRILMAMGIDFRSMVDSSLSSSKSELETAKGEKLPAADVSRLHCESIKVVLEEIRTSRQ